MERLRGVDVDVRPGVNGRDQTLGQGIQKTWWTEATIPWQNGQGYLHLGYIEPTSRLYLQGLDAVVGNAAADDAVGWLRERNVVLLGR